MRRFIALLVVVSLLGFASPAGATTTRVDFFGTQQTVDIGEPGKEWFSGPIHHARGIELLGVSVPDPSTGLPTGTTRATLSFNIDTTTFQGVAWGKGTLVYGDGGFETTFSGEIGLANVPGGVLGEFKLVGHGFGSFEGVQLRATVQEFIVTGFGSFEGELFMPGDR